MFSFGWKMMAASTIKTIYGELASLIIGKRYSSSDLAFYSKGKYFPKFTKDVFSDMLAKMRSVIGEELFKDELQSYVIEEID